MRETQKIRVLRYIQTFGSITQGQAYNDLGCARLASRISELRKEGHRIGRRMVPVKNRYGEIVHIAEYYLEDAA